MAELDSLSDSEWLDLANESDSDSSLTDSDNDQISDGISLPPSRRSSISIPSDADGEIEAWEGFADNHEGETTNYPLTAAQALFSRPEEEVVTAGLDQSMVGTLSASRSSSLGHSTVHNSIRDLRLSFPDPITSSRDELNRSYEAVPIPEAPGTTDDVSNSLVAEVAPAPVAKITLQDSVVDHSPIIWSDGLSFDVVLYGSTTQCREFSQWFTQTMFLSGGDFAAAPSPQSLARLSMAVISLPCSIALSEHTLYLPVVLEGADLSQVPENFKLLDIPPLRTLHLTQPVTQQYFIDSLDARARVDVATVRDQLLPVLQPQSKRPSKLTDGFKPVHAVTIVALVYIIASFVGNTMYRPSTITSTSHTSTLPPTQTTPSTFWAMFGTTPNSSIAPPISTTAVTSAAPMPSTLKDLALAVFNPATTTSSLHSVASLPSEVSKDQPTVKDEVSVKSNTDIIVRPQSSLSNPVVPRSPPASTPASPQTEARRAKRAPVLVEEAVPVTALSLKLEYSLSEVADATMKALEAVLPWDLRELMFAFDELLQAISHQTAFLIQDTKSQVRVLRNRLIRRNERAKQRARELREAGERWAFVARTNFQKRAKVASTRAHYLRERFVSTSSHVWKAYAQARGEWSEKLETKRAQRMKRTHGVGLFATLKQRRESRRQKRSR
ncbi:hypothetical protein MIND_00241800 [Mycena indigotica]|uniref:Uncharacterized protein n=1 Tax=Mycena indigotica TaxID=2126181 RepID=A0A8H6WEX0_9AGAR|nr:uncharacterized protein MIND_00241800 [Mycena indigotica]KAF7312288.1 hypothetical protein MIND_00241800 [Mycena indigotica]